MKLTKRIALALAAFTALSLLAGCAPAGEQEPLPTLPPLSAPIFQDRAQLSALYEQVHIEDKLADVIVRLGQPEKRQTANGEEYYEWRKDGAGVAASFRLDETVQGKVIYYDDLRQLQALTGEVDLSNAMLIKAGTEFMYAQALLGNEGVEIASSSREDQQGRVVVTRLYTWVNPDGSHLDVEVDEQDKVVECKSYLVAGA